MKLVRYADRPDLRERRFEELVAPSFPAYMNENVPGNLYWDRLYTDAPDFQVALVDGDELLAEAHAVPLPWDGTLTDLPSGWDEGFTRGMTSERPHTALMAIAISVAPAHKGRRLSSRMIETFVENARAAGLGNGVIAPVRPTWKERYPLTAIEQYVEWRRDDGRHFDPWLRIHELVGGENFFLFGMTEPEVQSLSDAGYHPTSFYEGNASLRGAIDLISSGIFSGGDRTAFEFVISDLLYKDRFMVLADYQTYIEAQERVEVAYADQESWSRKAILNVARTGFFTSDRSIQDYLDRIWHAPAFPVTK